MNNNLQDTHKINNNNNYLTKKDKITLKLDQIQTWKLVKLNKMFKNLI